MLYIFKKINSHNKKYTCMKYKADVVLIIDEISVFLKAFDNK